MHPFISRGSGAARENLDFVRDNERGIESNTKLTDQIGVVPGIVRQFLNKFRGPGFGDRTELLSHLIATHTDTVVSNTNGSRIRVEVNSYLEIRFTLKELLIRNRLEAQYVGRV